MIDSPVARRTEVDRGLPLMCGLGPTDTAPSARRDVVLFFAVLFRTLATHVSVHPRLVLAVVVAGAAVTFDQPRPDGSPAVVHSYHFLAHV